MSHSSRSDQSQSQPSQDLISNDPAMQQIISERNSLRAQNEQLWKIIEKQRVIIQNLQKDVSKITAERDLLRSSSPSGQEGGNNSSSNGHHHQQQQLPQQSNYTNPSGYQPTTQYQPSLHSKRSMERGDKRAQENPGTSEPASYDKEPELASSFNPNASFASTISTSDYRPAQHEQHHQQYQHQQQHTSSRHPHHHHHEQLHSGAPLTPSSTYDADYDSSKNDIRIEESGPYPNYDHGHPSQPDEDSRQDHYDPDTARHGSTAERDARMLAPRSDATPALN
ncbi:hypothetical protein BG003_005374, partial [Podila horticola]